jgi:hypothetical protein
MIDSVSTEKSQLAVRMPTGRTPLIFSSVSAARKVSSRSAPGGSVVFASCIHEWMPISWPSAATPRTSSG